MKMILALFLIELCMLSVICLSPIPVYAVPLQSDMDRPFTVGDDVDTGALVGRNRIGHFTYLEVLEEIDTISLNGHVGVAGWQLASLAELDGFFDEAAKPGSALHVDVTGGWVVVDGVIGKSNNTTSSGMNTGSTWAYDRWVENCNSLLLEKNIVSNNYLDAHSPDGFAGFVASFVATPIPEPASMLLFGVGMTVLVGARVRRNQ